MPLPRVHGRPEVRTILSTDQRYEQSADERIHFERDVFATTGTVHRESKRLAREQRLMQRFVPKIRYHGVACAGALGPRVASLRRARRTSSRSVFYVRVGAFDDRSALVRA